MIVRRIALNGFRNYDFETAEFDAGTNVICGANAQGKTNLLEAVYMLSTGRSFRTRFDRELIGFGCDAADILADVSSHGREQTVNLRLMSGRPKSIRVNAVRRNASSTTASSKPLPPMRTCRRPPCSPCRCRWAWKDACSSQSTRNA